MGQLMRVLRLGVRDGCVGVVAADLSFRVDFAQWMDRLIS